jgi:hypothetical protein
VIDIDLFLINGLVVTASAVEYHSSIRLLQLNRLILSYLPASAGERKICFRLRLVILIPALLPASAGDPNTSFASGFGW